jgi:hypothetical protein
MSKHTLAGCRVNTGQVAVMMTGKSGYTVIGNRKTIFALHARGLVDGHDMLTALGRKAVREWEAR